jgi:hypothetical protein
MVGNTEVTHSGGAGESFGLPVVPGVVGNPDATNPGAGESSGLPVVPGCRHGNYLAPDANFRLAGHGDDGDDTTTATTRPHDDGDDTTTRRHDDTTTCVSACRGKLSRRAAAYCTGCRDEKANGRNRILPNRSNIRIL